MGAELSDRHINLAQKILKEQFPNLNGLNSTLLQLKQQKLTEDMVKNKLQIIHCSERHHWVTASTVKTAPGVVIVVDSLFKSIDTETKSIILNLFQHNIVSEPRIKLVRSQQQKGSKDCGVFAIAMATTIALERNPSNVTFHQELMRAHSVDCLEKRKFTFFHDAVVYDLLLYRASLLLFYIVIVAKLLNSLCLIILVYSYMMICNQLNCKLIIILCCDCCKIIHDEI